MLKVRACSSREYSTLLEVVKLIHRIVYAQVKDLFLPLSAVALLPILPFCVTSGKGRCRSFQKFLSKIRNVRYQTSTFKMADPAGTKIVEEAK